MNWIHALPENLQQPLLNLSPAQISKAKVTGQWSLIQNQAQAVAGAEANAQTTFIYDLPVELLKNGWQQLPPGQFLQGVNDLKNGHTAQGLTEIGLASVSEIPGGEDVEAAAALAKSADAGSAAALAARDTAGTGLAEQSIYQLEQRDIISLAEGRGPGVLERNGSRTVLTQSGPTCGAVSCQMILSTAGKDVDLGKLIADTHTQLTGANPGASMDGLAEGLRANGITSARSVENLTLEELTKATAHGNPAIVGLDLGTSRHAVIVDGVTERYVEDELGQRYASVVAVRNPWGGSAGKVFVESDIFQELMSHEGVLTNPQ